MKLKLAALAMSLAASLSAQAQTEIQWWHSMTAVNSEWVNDLAKEFNASQKDIVYALNLKSALLQTTHFCCLV